MRKSISGFTIVEIVIVIVVIGILAAIVIVSYSNSQTRALNTARLTELKAWQKSFIQYKATNGAYPVMPDGGYCLGTDFPDGKCRDYYLPVGSITYSEASSAPLMEMLKTYDIPTEGHHDPIKGLSGPYANYYSAVIHITQGFYGNSNDCPAGTQYAWSSNNGVVLCRIALQR